MLGRSDVDDLIVNYDPELPQARKAWGACDMGNAMIGGAMQGCVCVTWYAVRNALDPQIPNATAHIDSRVAYLCREGRLHYCGERDRLLGDYRHCIQSALTR